MLTPKQAAFFHKVKIKKKVNGFKYAWTNNQQISGFWCNTD